LNKFWNLCVDNKLTSDDPTLDEKVAINECLTKISKDIEELSLNTSVSQFMISVNKLKALNCNNKIVLEKLVRALAPFAPYICEEIWERFGYKSSIHNTEFPKPFDVEIQQKEYLYPISINGKKKAEILMPLDITENEIVLLCKNNEKINKSME
jgi:leucyl-tRNA synthetase